MAFYNQNQNNTTSGQGMNNPDDDEQKQQQALGGSAPVQLTGVSANGANNAAAPQAGAPAPGQPNKPASSGMAPGFQNYAKANQGAATNKLANAAQTNVRNLGQQAQTSIQQATNAFGQKVEAGSLKNRQQAVQDVANAVQAARNINAPTAPTAPAQPNAAAAPAQAPNTGAPATNALGGMDQSQVDRFKEVINARYEGPESLRQAGLYNPTAQKVDAANQAVKNSATAQGREELLRSMYEKRGDYTRGLNKLDSALLNSSQQNVQNLQNTANQYKNVANDLNKAQVNSSSLAQGRAHEIKDIQNQARDKFSTAKTETETAVDKTIDDTLGKWDTLPQHLRDVLAGKKGGTGTGDQLYNQFTAGSEYQSAQANLNNAQKAYESLRGKGKDALEAQAYTKFLEAQKAMNTVQSQADKLRGPGRSYLSQAEADFIGIKEGEGLYNLGADVIQTAAKAGRDEIVTRDDQARLAALSALAGLDQSNKLDTTLKYADAAKAGTKTLADAFDKQKTREILDQQEKNFQTSLKSFDPNLNKRITSQLGYNTSAPSASNLLSNADVLKGIGASSTPWTAHLTGHQLNPTTKEGKRVNDFLNNNNFEKRVDIANTSELSTRASALQSLLESLKQNKG